jgi:hypothetical protein
MKIISFDYTKADGKVSKRTVVVTAEPTHLYAGTDISSLNDEDQALYINEYIKIKDIYLEMLKNLNSTYDLNFNYRQFKPENMKIIEEELM